MPAACDTNGDGACAEGEGTGEHPLLGGRVVVELDGADTCVLPWSEREANARQTALAALNAELFG